MVRFGVNLRVRPGMRSAACPCPQPEPYP